MYRGPPASSGMREWSFFRSGMREWSFFRSGIRENEKNVREFGKMISFGILDSGKDEKSFGNSGNSKYLFGNSGIMTYS